MSRICVRAKVSGHVQGVGFRYHTAHEGLKLGLTGYAKNLVDGDVEVLVCGQQPDVDALVRWLETGPRTATVNHLDVEEVEWRHIEGSAFGNYRYEQKAGEKPAFVYLDKMLTG